MYDHWNSQGILKSRAFWIGVLIGAIVLPALLGGQRALLLVVVLAGVVVLLFVVWKLCTLLLRGFSGIGRGVTKGVSLVVRAHQQKTFKKEFEEASRNQKRKQARENRRQRRRQDARSACERFYALHAPEIAERFSRELFQQYLERYLGDDVPIHAVERRARELQHLIGRHLEEVRPQNNQNLGDVFAEYERKRNRIESSDLSPEWKASLLDKLKEQQFDLFNRALEDV